MSQFIANSFQVPNAVVDELMAKMSANALRCYLLITRKTTGWGKSSDKISASQFMDYLGIKDKRTIYTALTELANLGLINTIKNNGGITEYSLVLELSEPVTKNAGTKNVTSSKKCTEPVTKNVPTTSNKKCHSTKDNIKNNITKKRNTVFDPISVKPQNVSLDVWCNWIDYRNSLGKKLQPQSWIKQSQMLEEQENPEAMINRSIMNGWQGLFPLKNALTTGSPVSDTSWINDLNGEMF
ncbi:replication protein [Gilliamella sp. N-G2]|uniref:replication protein n=1 Tax=Gilliamella sp. N-G2 TaxID=1970471 RepID=UPI000A354062|nr:replication protein [Gilliamella sp. N-G2]OTQ74723.1 hypothetical protein B6C99_02920 [Gilliamella sp. N-G2]